MIKLFNALVPQFTDESSKCHFNFNLDKCKYFNWGLLILGLSCKTAYIQILITASKESIGNQFGHWK